MRCCVVQERTSSALCLEDISQCEPACSHSNLLWGLYKEGSMLTQKESVCGEGNRQKEEVSSCRSKGHGTQ